MGKVKTYESDRLVFDLNLHQIDYNEQKKNLLRKQIADKYGVPLRNVEVNFVPITVNEKGEKISLASDIITNIQDPAFQQSLYGVYMEMNEIKDVALDEIIAIDKQVNSFIDFDSYSKYKSYKFKYVKWSNYLSYGPDNYFDFTKLNGLVRLNGQPENQCGKTTFAIDLLRFALFGKAQKSPTLDSVFNIYLPEQTEVIVEAGLEIESVDYVIRRTVTRPPLNKRTKKSKTKQKLEYFRLINGSLEEIDNCEGENNTETNNIIKDSVGDVEDFNLVISATAYTLGDLLRKGQTDKGRLFSRWLGLLSIERKEEIAKELWKKNVSPKLLSSKYDASKLTEEVELLNSCIAKNNEEIKEDEAKLAQTDERISGYEEQKKSVFTQRREVKAELANIDISTVENTIENETVELGKKRSQMMTLKEEYEEVRNAEFDEGKLEELRGQLETTNSDIYTLRVKNAELKTKIGSIRADNERIQKLIEGGQCPTCGQTINNDEQNGHIEKNNQEIEALIKEGVENKKKIDEFEAACTKLKEEIEKCERDRKLVAKKKELELRMIAIKSNIDALKLSIKELERQREDYETNRENIKYNNEIDNKIRVIEESIKTENGVRDSVIRNITHLKSQISGYESEIAQRSSVLQTLKEEERIIRNWTIYQEMVGKNGIVKIVLKRALPILNNEVSRLLNGLCDFNVDISVSEDNKVCMDLVRAGQKLDLGIAASGFETVMASVAIRHALSCIATLSKPNFTVYDEILDGVAVSNYDNVRELFNRMTKSYDFIIHITHNEFISDWHSSIITVTKNSKGVSVIQLNKV